MKCFPKNAKCGKNGHIQTICRNKSQGGKFTQKGKHKQLNSVEDVAIEDTDSEEDFPISLLSCIDNVGDEELDPIFVDPVINGVKLRMEYDTGAACSVISKAIYDKSFSDLQLKPSKRVFRSYTGDLFSPIGSVYVSVTLQDQTWRDLELAVIERDEPPLFGRNWIRKMNIDWNSVHSVQVEHFQPSDLQQRLNSVLDKHQCVFSEELGTLTSTKAKLVIDKDASPKFCKPRQVPYALKPMVETELRRMEKEGIISKVDWSE